MLIRKNCGYVLTGKELFQSIKGRLDTFTPVTIPSTNWVQWKTEEDIKVCIICDNYQGQIYPAGKISGIIPPVHRYCRCEILPIEAIVAGNATKDGKNGADYWLAHYGKLPSYYITKKDLFKLGWHRGDAPAKFAPGKMTGDNPYNNKEGHLPSAPGRTWREADINYYKGKRNRHRVFYSNDGLIFVTYDHGKNFYEIVKGAK